MKPIRIDLSNGLTVLHSEVPHTRAVHCVLMANAGTRDESQEESGMAHFIEHMLFRGTKRRKNFQILNYLESVGGDLNAYTTKEKTTVYASINRDFAGRSFDLLADLIFKPSFPGSEIPKEKAVIADEIDMYFENPEEMIFEEFENLCFSGGSLGNPILGTKESIKKFTPAMLRKFQKRTYTKGRLVFSVSGAISLKEVEKFAKKYLEPIRLPAQKKRSNDQSVYKKFNLTKKFPSQQAHRIIGGCAMDIHSKDLNAFILLNNHLGGPAMNSVLSLKIREKHGLTYNIYSFFSPYIDKGSWGSYFACDPKQLDRVTALAMKEINELKNNKISSQKLDQMKRQFIGQMTLGQESMLARTLAFAKDHLDFGRTFSLEEMTDMIEKVTPSGFMNVAREMLNEKKLSTLTFMPEK